MDMSKIYLAPECIGTGIELVNVTPDMYVEGVRQPTPVGYRYDVLLRDHKWDRLTVRIPGQQQMEAPASGASISVMFDGLRIRPYVARNSGSLAYSAVADSIRPIQSGRTAESRKA